MADTDKKKEEEEEVSHRDALVQSSITRVKEALQTDPEGVNDEFWAQEFQKLFLEGWEDRDDDLVYYVKCEPFQGDPFLTKRIGSPDSPSLDDKEINWEESYYLNMVLHSFTYHLTITVDSQVMKKPTAVSTKVVTTVYASPNKIQMEEEKGHNLISYPDIFFTIHDFHELFDSVVCAKNERLCVEIVACLGKMRVAVFQGSVLFEKLLEVYQAKRGSAWAEYLPSNMRSQNIQFLDMKGPRGKGRAQISIKKVKVKNTNNEQNHDHHGPLDGMFRWWDDAVKGSWWGREDEEEKGGTTKLNACLAFVSINLHFITADFLSNTFREPSLDKTFVKE